MAVFLSRAFDLADGPDPGFGDVPATAWFAAEVAKLAASGITVGCGGSNFCPDRETNRAEMAVFLARATGKIQTPERVTQAPAVLLSYTTPEAMHGSEAWPSPDWRHVAYLANVTRDSGDWGWNEVGDLYVAAADGSNLTKVASDVLGDEGRCGADGLDDWCGLPAVWWSPDGSRFWYVTIEDRDDQGEATSLSLRVAAADGTRSVQVTRDSPGIRRDDFCDFCDYGWSFDSQHIAYIIEGDDAGEGDDASLFVVAADGTNPTRLTDYDAYSSWTWSPDSRHIIYQDRDGVLYSARADGTNPSELAAARDYWWSPDGSRIAYSSWQEDGLYLFTARADGSGTVKLGDGGDNVVVWSPDSRHIAYDDVLAGVRTLYSARADGSGTVKLGDGGDNVVWSPDSRHIAYDDRPAGVRTLYSARADGSGTVKLGDEAEYVGWSPDGSRIAYTSQEEDGRYLFTARVDGSGTIRLVEHSQRSWSAPPFAWSPDGSRIAYLARDNDDLDLFTVRADGSNVTELSDSVYPVFVWSPDGSRIAYVTLQPDQERESLYRGSVKVIGTDGAKIAEFATSYWVSPFSSCYSPALTWRRDGIVFDFDC